MVVINGKKYDIDGSVSIINGKVLVNGKRIEDLDTIEQKEINITINGEVEMIDIDGCRTIAVTGNVHSIKTMSGNVDIHGDVIGDVKTMSGSIDCGDVKGSVSSMSGNIKRK